MTHVFFFSPWQCKLQKSHVIWSFQFKSGPLSFVVKNHIQIWFVCNVISVIWRWGLISEFMVLLHNQLAWIECLIVKSCWQMLLNVALDVIKFWVKSASMKPFTSLSHQPLHPHSLPFRLQLVHHKKAIFKKFGSFCPHLFISLHISAGFRCRSTYKQKTLPSVAYMFFIFIRRYASCNIIMTCYCRFTNVSSGL